jgi:hypothetical protein
LLPVIQPKLFCHKFSRPICNNLTQKHYAIWTQIWFSPNFSMNVENHVRILKSMRALVDRKISTKNFFPHLELAVMQKNKTIYDKESQLGEI